MARSTNIAWSDDVNEIVGTHKWLEVPAIQFETIIVGQPESPPANHRCSSRCTTCQSCCWRNRRASAQPRTATCDLRRTGTAKYRMATEGKHHVAKESRSIVGGR